jgi:hypothetical protein
MERKTVRMLSSTLVLVAALCGSIPAWSQYPGQLKKDSAKTPELRAIAVLEWTGEPGKPKASRIVPITVYDGEKLQDAGVYLARPQPLALSGEVEYELEQNGKPFGLFDIKEAGQEQGSWVGFGDWKPMPRPKSVKATLPEKIDDVEDDKPVLHRKKHAGETSPGTASSGSGTASSSAPDDPDRPKLHKKTDDTSTAGSGTSSTASGSGPAPDTDRPVLHKHPDDSSTTASSSNPTSNSDSSSASAPRDSDRPTLKKGKQKPAEDIGHVDSVPDETDLDRPHLKRGKSSGPGGELTPTLMGLPADMQQAVAVSDARTRPEHPWTFSWANPDDEAKMKAAVEDIARQALGLVPPPAPPVPAPHRPAATHTGTAAATTHAGTAAAHKSTRPATASAEPPPLQDEEFRVFELAYGAGATLVLTADSGGPLPSRKFVTIVAQPDLYGNARVLFKSVTDMAHLDETPRMRLVDAVDALADNRGELLFELRGDGTRQFALYRVYRGTAEKLFVTGGEPYATTARSE